MQKTIFKIRVDKKEALSEQEKEVLSFIDGCANFWNSQGPRVFVENLTGKLGDEKSNQKVKNTNDYPGWLFDNLLVDLKGLSKKFKINFGKAGSHVWVHVFEGDEEVYFLTITTT